MFRRLCDKLYLKAETQQIDRILDQFSRRYYQNNPGSVYGSAGASMSLASACRLSFGLTVSPDVVHAVTYSILLLNTDLHVVETTTRMTSKQFVRNTMSTIHLQAAETPERRHYKRPVTAPSGDDNEILLDSRHSYDKFRPRSSRNGSITGWQGSTRDAALSSTPNLHATAESPNENETLETTTPSSSVYSLQSPATTSAFGSNASSPARDRSRETELESLLRVRI
jgi:PH/SEC7 domain-containing protein